MFFLFIYDENHETSRKNFWIFKSFSVLHKIVFSILFIVATKKPSTDGLKTYSVISETYNTQPRILPLQGCRRQAQALQF